MNPVKITYIINFVIIIIIALCIVSYHMYGVISDSNEDKNIVLNKYLTTIGNKYDDQYATPWWGFKYILTSTLLMSMAPLSYYIVDNYWS